jgi:DNA-binding transcriptional ArsR family regulator
MGLPAEMSDELVSLIADRFRAIGEPTRIRILDRLRRGEASVHELAHGVGTSQQNVSKHLGLLSRAGIVGRRKRGTSVYYRIVDESVLAMCEQVCGGVQRDIGSLAAAVRGERVGEPN